jgi:acetoacetyl-CoA synthetase
VTPAVARGEVLWTPQPGEWERSAIGRFAAARNLDSYRDLIAWSIADIDGFWAASIEATGMRWFRRPDAIREGDAMPGVRWFPGGLLNYTDQALVAAAANPDGVAVVAHSQTRRPQELTWSQLRDQVALVAAGLRRLGVGAGDRVVAFAPDVPETLVAFLATAAIGAVWSSCAPEFGVKAVVDRFAQIEPAVLVAVDGYRYGAKEIDKRSDVAEIVAALPSVRHVVAVPYLWPDEARPPAPGATGPSIVTWAELEAPDPGESPDDLDLVTTPVAADHPLYVLFSSGTTGLPKAIVHGHGGIVAEHLKVLALHHDLGPGDRLFWFTTTGWMMWNYKVSALLCGATVVLFDGDPGWPSLDGLWDTVERTNTTVFGTSASFLMACRKAGLTPSRGTLRSVGSTGSPLPPDGFRWVVATLGVPITSVCGGTDVCTAFIGSSVGEAVRAGEIGGRFLGCAVDAFAPDATPCPPGVTGELVLTRPLPSMPIGFWGDVDGARYRAAYFEHYPGVWRHGDWITFHDDGSCTVTGRSDATLNRGGVRLGTSDFYTVVEAFDEVADSLVVHLEDATGGGGLGELVLFVALVPGAELTDELAGRIRRALARELSPRHAPDAIEVVPIVPRTLSGKKLELPVKRILGGADVDDVASRDSLADPSSLDSFAARRRS